MEGVGASEGKSRCVLWLEECVFERGRENKERVWLSGYMRVSTCKKGGKRQ